MNPCHLNPLIMLSAYDMYHNVFKKENPILVKTMELDKYLEDMVDLIEVVHFDTDLKTQALNF